MLPRFSDGRGCIAQWPAWDDGIKRIAGEKDEIFRIAAQGNMGMPTIHYVNCLDGVDGELGGEQA